MKVFVAETIGKMAQMSEELLIRGKGLRTLTFLLIILAATPIRRRHARQTGLMEGQCVAGYKKNGIEGENKRERRERRWLPSTRLLEVWLLLDRFGGEFYSAPIVSFYCLCCIVF